MVGGRHTMVGKASGMSKSVTNCLRPVTMSSPSVRFVGLPMILNSDSGLSWTSSCRFVWLAAFSASSA
jgi:hypothetical protein